MNEETKNVEAVKPRPVNKRYFDNKRFNEAYLIASTYHVDWLDKNKTVSDEPESREVSSAKNNMMREIEKIVNRVMIVFRSNPSWVLEDMRADVMLHCWNRMGKYDATRHKAFNFFTSVVINKLRTDYMCNKKRTSRNVRFTSIVTSEQLKLN